MNRCKRALVSVLALGLVAGATVGVAAQDDPLEPASVTGTMTAPVREDGGSPELIEGFGMQRQGQVWTNEWDTMDPRLNGTFRVLITVNAYSAQQMEVVNGVATLENDGGRWVGDFTMLDSGRAGTTGTLVLEGQDAYDGLTAYVVLDPRESTIGAAIFPGEMPPIPEAEAPA